MRSSHPQYQELKARADDIREEVIYIKVQLRRHQRDADAPGPSREDVDRLRADITNPSNYRAVEKLDAWLKKRNIIGIAGIDTRALTARIRESGMPNGVIAHAPDGYFHEPSIMAELKAFPGLEGLDLAYPPPPPDIGSYEIPPVEWP